MLFLVDNVVSWRVAKCLRENGHDAIHVADLGMAEAEDGEIYTRAVTDRRVIVTQDSDFERIHQEFQTRTGVILIRLSNGKPAHHCKVLIGLLDRVHDELVGGAFVLVDDTVVRIR